LADVGPPRHAIESDDEDEFNPLSPQRPPTKRDLAFEIVNEGKATAETLIFASMDAGRQVHPCLVCVRIKHTFFARVWARGANLGEQLGTISVNKECVCTDLPQP